MNHRDFFLKTLFLTAFKNLLRQPVLIIKVRRSLE